MPTVKITRQTGARRPSSAYSSAYNQLKVDLKVVKELNFQLPKSVQETAKKKREEFGKEIRNLDEKSRNEFAKFVDEMGKISQSMKKGKHPARKSITLKGKSAKILAKFVQDTLLFPDRFNLFIRDMSLTYLIAEFEGFLRQILDISFQIKPEILMTCQKSITYEELMKFKDIADARQQIIEKEINSIISQDIEEVNKYFDTKFKVKMPQLVNWRKFTERFYRRNILIHNSGITNKIYRLKTGYKGKDTRMTVTEDYLNESIKLLGDMARQMSELFQANKLK